MKQIELTDAWETELTVQSNHIADIELKMLDKDFMVANDLSIARDELPVFILKLDTAVRLRDFLSREIRLIERYQKERGEEDV